MYSNQFYSNCLIECIKAWFKSPFNISIHKRGNWKMLFRKNLFPHFYWKDKKSGRYYDFARDTKPKGLHDQIIFKGYIREIRYLMFFGH